MTTRTLDEIQRDIEDTSGYAAALRAQLTQAEDRLHGLWAERRAVMRKNGRPEEPDCHSLGEGA